MDTHLCSSKASGENRSVFLSGHLEQNQEPGENWMTLLKGTWRKESPGLGMCPVLLVCGL